MNSDRGAWLGLAMHVLTPALALVFTLVACAEGGTGAATSSLPSPSTLSCVDLWVEVYDTSVASGVTSGEARRLADAARAECEGLGTTVPSIAPGPVSACSGDDQRRNAPAIVDDPRYVSVYFSCEGDFAFLGTSAQPLYMFVREIPSSMTDTSDERLEAALSAYLAGPRPNEVDRGYFSAGAAPLADLLTTAEITRGTARIDFSSKVVDHLGNIGTATASQVFLLEMQATAFQFPEVKEVVIQVDGDCDAFWRLLEMSCQSIQRPKQSGG